jgi:hypothetical protein
VAAVDWTAWLRDFNRELLERLDLDEDSAFRDPRVTSELVAGGWLGSPAADESVLAAAEDRLGAWLPPSYRSFLATSNGFLQPDLIVPRLRSAEEIGWYGDLDAASAATWAEFAEADEPISRLAGCLQVSDVELVGTAVYLLDPTSRGADDEWEAYFLAHWVPGVDRYPSFIALMNAQRRMHLDPPAPEDLAPRSSPSAWRVLCDAIRNRTS